MMCIIRSLWALITCMTAVADLQWQVWLWHIAPHTVSTAGEITVHTALLPIVCGRWRIAAIKRIAGT
jgi:hypothetical protein